eukprot:2753108-Rhodomonas_salina.1
MREWVRVHLLDVLLERAPDLLQHSLRALPVSVREKLLHVPAYASEVSGESEGRGGRRRRERAR